MRVFKTDEIPPGSVIIKNFSKGPLRPTIGSPDPWGTNSLDLTKRPFSEFSRNVLSIPFRTLLFRKTQGWETSVDHLNPTADEYFLKGTLELHVGPYRCRPTQSRRVRKYTYT